MDKELLEEKFKHHENKLLDHDKRIEKLEDTYQTLSNLNYRMGKVETIVDNIDKKLDENKEEKGKKWDKLIDYIFYFILALILGYIAIKLGLQ